jgi:hypothetical protein
MSVPPSLELQGALGARAKGELEVKNEGARAREVHLRLGHLRASEGEPFEVKAGFLDGEGFPLRGALSVEAGEAAVASLWVELDPQAFEAGQCYQGELVAEDQDGVQETISVGLTVLPHGEPDVLSDGVPSDGAPSDGAPSDGGPHEGGERLERLEAQLAELRAQLEAQNKQQALLLEQLSRFVGGASGEQPAGEQPAGEKPAGEKPAGVGGRQRRPKSGGG